MSLYSVFFIPFIFIVFVGYYGIPVRFRYIWLLIASLVFYLSGGIEFIWGLFGCIILTFLSAYLIENAKEDNTRKILFFCSVMAQTAIFVIFRLLSNKGLFIQLGVSFYSLQALSYVMDVYRGKYPAERNFFKVALYICFFPTIISGPIERPQNLLRQISEVKPFDYVLAHKGLYTILGGILLKTMIATPLNSMVEMAYSRPWQQTGAVLLWATILYGIQLFADFAGYSMLACGTANLFGFEIMTNFKQPYLVENMGEFWGRWHISLSKWLRDYIYIPLGGNRKGKLRKAVNSLIVFVISAAWHGNGLQYLVWGFLHFLYQYIPSWKTKNFVVRVLKSIFCFALVDFAWLFFRADSLRNAVFIIQSIVSRFDLKQTTYYGSYLLGKSKSELFVICVSVLIAFVVELIHEKNITIEALMAPMPLFIRWMFYSVITIIVILVYIRTYGTGGASFIYAGF